MPARKGKTMTTTEREWTAFDACATVEGFCGGEDATDEDRISALAYLVKTGVVWNLQGFYGRTAAAAIEAGLISPEGEVDWDRFNDLV